MSRSYWHNVRGMDRHKSRKYFKRLYNKRVRRYKKGISDFSTYKKLIPYFQYSITEYNWFVSEKDEYYKKYKRK